MKNHAALVRAKAAKAREMAERRDEDVRARADHKQRMRLIEEQMAEELREPSEYSHALGDVVLGKASPQQVAESSRSRSPNWRTQRIKSPIERLQDTREEARALLEDPVNGWGWHDMDARASRTGNFEELPFRQPRQDLVWLVPEHLKGQLLVEAAPRPREEPRGSSKSEKRVPNSAATALINSVASLW